MERESSVCIGHEPCPSCGSRNNLGRYSDGHGWCFGCGYYEKGTQRMGESTEFTALPTTEEGKQKEVLSFQGEIADLPKRGIREDTTRLWSYRVGEVGDKGAHFAYYLDVQTRRPIACKVRFADKSFTWLGDARSAPLYGQWLWRDGGKLVVVTEGEIDALSVSQVQGNKWPVVSVQNGAQGASKSIRKAIDWLNKFETVVFMFDMDEHGRKAAIECAKLLPPGKAKIANLALKDANELLTNGRGSEIINSIWGASVYRPDGIVAAADLWDSVSIDDTTSCVSSPYAGLDLKTSGIRKRELVTITAGSGIGKSLFCREMAYHLMTKHDWKVGYIALEESNKRTVQGLMSIHINKPLHQKTDEVKLHKDAFDVVTNNLYLYDSFGSIDPENLIERLRYLAVGMQCDALFLDHISIAISGLEEIDERRALDVMMTKLRSLVEETGVAMFVVSHLKRPSMSDKGHEQGLQTSLAQLRGSHAIAQLSDMVVGLERNQQGENPNETVVRVLKNRYSGETGVATSLYYSKDTGRLTEQPFEEEDGYAEF